MKNSILVSVIIPIYNAEKYLCKCVDSVLAQTYKNLEVILVDDASTDSSGQICDQYASQDKRIRVIHQQNGGVSVARNTGIKAAQGKYISFIDSDDWVAPTFIEILLNTAEKNHSAISVVGRYNVFPHTTQHRHMQIKPNVEKVFSASQQNFSSEETLTLLFLCFDVCVTSKLFPASIFKYILFPIGLTFEDSWILYRLFQHVSKIAVYNIPLYYYNLQNENSLSKGKFRQSMLDYFKVTDDFLVEAKTFKSTKILRQLQRDRISHICGFLKRMMLSDFNDQTIISPLLQELRQNLWILFIHPKPFSVTMFGICCAISFKLAKTCYLKVYKHD